MDIKFCGRHQDSQMVKQARKLQATLVQNYDSLTYSLTGVKCRATSVAKTSQELRMLSSVTLNCQATKIVMDSGSQLSEL